MPLPHPLDPAVLLEQAGWVRSLVRGLIREEALAEDVVQETWLAAIERRPTWDRPGGARAWLASVARNLALRARRREFLRRAVERDGARAEGTPGGQDVVERMQLQERLAAAVLALEEPYRTAILLRHVDGHSHAEVARLQGCTPAAARQRVARGLAQLRARLAGEFEDRESWCLALGRLAAASGNGGVLATGGVLMASKIALSAGACALIAALWWGLAAERGPAAASSREPGAVARKPDPTRALDGAGGDPEAASLEPASASSAGGRLPLGLNDDLDSLSGLVTDTRGRPLGRAVVLLPTGDPAAPEKLVVDHDGRFAIDLVRARHVARPELSFSCPGFLTEHVRGEPGQELLVALRTLPAFTGTLRGEDGAPVTPPGKVILTVEESAGGAESERECELGPDGSFSFPELAPGRVKHLWARARGHAHRELEPDLALVPDRVQRMDVTLPDGALVTGVVVDEESREPVPGARVWLESREFEGADSLHPTAIADARGRFSLPGSEVEDYRTEEHEFAIFHLQGDAPGYIPSPARGYGSVPNEEQEYEFELALTRVGASLELALREPDGSPASNVQLFVADSQGNHGFESADARGLFLRDLPAGRLALRVLGQHAHADLDLELAAGETRREELVLRPDHASIRGLVTDALGRPLQVELTLNRHLVAPGLEVAFEARTTQSDAAGQYAFEGLPAGRFELRFETSDCPLPAQATLEPRDEDALEADFVLGACMVVAGRVEPGSKELALLSLELRDPSTESVVATARPEADGSFRLEPCFAAPYELVLLQEETELDRTRVGPARSAGIVLRSPR